MQTHQKNFGENFGWNELDFLDRAEFLMMGPPIVKLEVKRIERLLLGNDLDEAVRHGLQRARLELVRFVTALEDAPTNLDMEALSDNLRRAVLNIAIHANYEDGQVRYVLDRLRYVHNRMSLIY